MLIDRRVLATAAVGAALAVTLHATSFAGTERAGTEGAGTARPGTEARPASPDATAQWAACPGADAVFRCGTVTVPTDYRGRVAGTLDIATVRVAATGGPAERRGTIMVEPGGPGGSGVDQVLQTYEQLPQQVRQHFDVVGFDPRGVGRSSPLRCWSPAQAAAAFAGATSRPDLRRVLADADRFTDGCVRGSAELAPFVGTEFVARDIDRIRAAVGAPKLDLLFVSYGTFVATVYANLFPHRIRTATLDGGMDPRQYADGGYANDRRQYQAAGRAFERFLDWCTANAAQCGFGDGAPRAAYDALITDLDRPVTPGVGNATTLSYAVLLTLNAGRQAWPGLGQALAEAQRGAGPLVEAGLPEELAVDLFTPNTAVECADRRFPPGVGRLRAELARSARLGGRLGPAVAFGPPGYDHSHAPTCVRWPIPQLSRYAGPFDAPAAPTMLVVGTTGDPDTPFADSVSLARLLSARLLTFRAEGHAALLRSACVTDAVTRYLLDRRLPAAGTVCADERLPQ